MTLADVFCPPVLLRNRHLQSYLASSSLRRRLIKRHNPAVLDQATEVLLDCGDGVRLQGWHSAQASHSKAPGLAVLLHGWGGSADSTYLLDAAERLFAAGFDVFRLNFRDHGDTHHLNTGIFHSCLIDEAVAAVAQIETTLARGPLLLAGFSLGGNFALRIARRASDSGVALAHTVAVSPIISPAAGLKAIEDAGLWYQSYFMRKWRRSLRAKQALFPDLYDGALWQPKAGIRELTNCLVESLTDFSTIDDYFDGYSIVGDRLAEMAAPASIVTSADDPVIPVVDFHQLKLAPQTELLIQPYGGHCGFVDKVGGPSWISIFLARRFMQAIELGPEAANRQAQAETMQEI
jgi:predicted alpha/beta-fold hydrolase